MNSDDFDYRLYGLTIRSNQPLLYLHPLPPSATADMAITIQSDLVPPVTLGAEAELRFEQTFPDQATLRGWRTPAGIHLVYTNMVSDVAHIHIDSSGALHVSLAPTLHLEHLLPILYGAALSVSLHIRGLTCLHACAIAVDDQAALIVGSSGIGKSTLAAALLERGLQFVTDDLAVLAESLDPPAFAVQPGCDALRLWTNTVTAISSKIWQPVSAPASALPIRMIYLLATTSGQPGIFPTTRQAAFLNLAKHVYASALQPAANLTRSLERLRLLIDQVPVRLLVRSRLPADVPATAALIERDLRATLQAQP